MSALILASLAPAVIAALVIALLRRSRTAAWLADHPNERSMHDSPTPRVGGIGIAVGVTPFMLAYASTLPLATIAACAAGLFAISLADDVRSLPVQVRLPAHFAAGLVVVLALSQPGSPWPWGWAAGVLAVAGLAWSANLYNFMDGVDGMAGGMGTIGFGALAIAAIAAGHHALGISCLALSSACVGFLVHNFPPARAFLGDCGAIPLGFLAGAFGLYGALQGAWPAWFPLLVFSPFIVDATATLIRRLGRRERVWIAHRSHAYQRLALAGWSRMRVVATAWALMFAAAMTALWSLGAGETGRCVILFVWAVAYALLVPAVGWLTRRKA